MTCRDPALKVAALTITLIAVSGSRGRAQTGERATFVGVGAGLAAEPSELGIRSGLGFSLSASVGKDLSTHTALEARLGGEIFAAPAQYISPGGCLGQLPCVLPQPTPVHVVTFATDVLFARGRHGTGPQLLFGGGVRHLGEASGYPTETRPFVEMGGGAGRSFGTATISIEARYQLAASYADAPHWTIPIGLDVRFF